ncbi:unnamed protein product [Paramecium primaurelia]|uniref:RING-type domain-containing protein n=1 Tax=Paramecium primaurelia TaxID=5886 RepID=A0A8S1MBD4_PARPR|nr:unnamed protein product [Paramecium primaurelia]
MLSQQSQQSQSKPLRCKRCNIEVPNSKLYEHYEICQKQFLIDQPNCNQVHKNTKPILNNDQNTINQSSSPIISQENNIQNNNTLSNSQSIGFKMVKQCDSCEQYFTIDIYYEHQDECQREKQLQKNNENQMDMSTLIFQTSQEIYVNKQNTDEVQDEFDQEIVRSDYTTGGTYKRTVIKKDKKTGFTNYKTSYQKKQNKFLDDKNANKTNQEIISNDEIDNQSNQNQQDFLDIDNLSTLQSEDGIKCSICNQQYEQLDQTKRFEACKHQFHLNCIQNKPCPICAAQQLQKQ